MDSVKTGNNLAKTPITSGPEQSTTTFSVTVTPEQVRPYPTAKPRVLSGRDSKKGSTKILTDTPVKKDRLKNKKPKEKIRKHRVVRLEEKLGKLEILKSKKRPDNKKAICGFRRK